MKKAIIIIPTYNEKENIAAIVPQIFAATKDVKNYQIEILVVDDTSPDKTYEVVKKMQKKFPHLHLLINPEKAGLGGAYMKGMDQAFNHLGADYIFEFDADGSHDPAKLPEFFAKLDQGYDFVIGGRYRSGGSIPSDWPLIRKFYSVFGNLVIMTVLTDFRIRDWTSGYRAISQAVYQAVIPELQGSRFSGYTWQIGFLHKAVRNKFQITEVPINFVDRTIGESKLGSEYIKNTLIYIFKARYDEIINHRIFKFAVTGAIGSLVQLISFAIFNSLLVNPEFFWQTQVANFASIELAIISNFIINGAWTFADRALKKEHLLPKFLQFNLASAGSVTVQLLLMWALVELFGSQQLATLFGFSLTSETIYQIIGILIAMVFNYFFYNTFIWKKTPEKSQKPSSKALREKQN